MQRSTDAAVRRHFNYSNVMSTLAVFLVVAGGSAMAAAVDSSRDIAKQSVKNSDVKKNTLKSNRLRDNKAVADVDLIPNTLTGRVIAPDAIGTTEIAPDAITTPKIADQAVTTPKIADQAVTTPKIADQAVTTEKFADASVNSAKIADGQVRAVDLGPITRRTTTVAIAQNTTELVITTCLPGERAITGGGAWGGNFNAAQAQETHIVHSFPVAAGTAWGVRVYQNAVATRDFTAHAMCLEV